MLNELRIQYARRHFYRFSHDPSITGVSVNVNGGTVNGVSQNINFGAPTGDGEDFVQGIGQIVDNFTYMRGTHSYKTGFDIQWISDHREVPLPGDLYVPVHSGLQRRQVRGEPARLHDVRADARRARIQHEERDVQRVRAGRLEADAGVQAALRRALRLLHVSRRHRGRALQLHVLARRQQPRAARWVSRGRSTAPPGRSCAGARASCTTSRSSPSSRTRMERRDWRDGRRPPR